MSSWVALNVEYDEDDWLKPNPGPLGHRMAVIENPEDDFDLLMYVFTSRGDWKKEQIIQNMLELAYEGGTPTTMVTVSGNDTSDVFVVELIDGSGSVVRRWSTNVDWGHHEYNSDFMDRVEQDLGMRPSYGGNYK